MGTTAQAASPVGAGTLSSIAATRSAPGQVARAGQSRSWHSVSGGEFHSCATRTDHTLWCWGAAAYGELGTGRTEGVYPPVQVGFATDWRSVAAGYGHTCGVRIDGTLWCWGYNNRGQLGDRHTPVKVGFATT